MSKAQKVQDKSSEHAWLFPVLLAVIVSLSAAVVSPTIRLSSAPTTAVPARLTWAVAAMLFAILFAFALVACNTLMFQCGNPQDAFRALVGTTLVGVLSVVACYWFRGSYVGPEEMSALLKATALCLPGVRALSAVFDGFALWAALLVVRPVASSFDATRTTPRSLAASSADPGSSCTREPRF